MPKNDDKLNDIKKAYLQSARVIRSKAEKDLKDLANSVDKTMSFIEQNTQSFEAVEQIMTDWGPEGTFVVKLFKDIEKVKTGRDAALNKHTRDARGKAQLVSKIKVKAEKDVARIIQKYTKKWKSYRNKIKISDDGVVTMQAGGIGKVIRFFSEGSGPISGLLDRGGRALDILAELQGNRDYFTAKSYLSEKAFPAQRVASSLSTGAREFKRLISRGTAIPKLARGAIVSRGTVFQAGEKGPEAVVPLNSPEGASFISLSLSSFLGIGFLIPS